MSTLQAQRLKKLQEWDYRHGSELITQILEEGQKEMERLQSLLVSSEETTLTMPCNKQFEEYREDDEAVYFEAGIIER